MHYQTVTVRDFHVTQKEVGTALGVSRATLYRALTDAEYAS